MGINVSIGILVGSGMIGNAEILPMEKPCFATGVWIMSGVFRYSDKWKMTNTESYDKRRAV